MITLIIKEGFFHLNSSVYLKIYRMMLMPYVKNFYILNIMTLIGLSRVLQILFILTFIKFIDDINKINSSHNFYIVF